MKKQLLWIPIFFLMLVYPAGESSAVKLPKSVSAREKNNAAMTYIIQLTDPPLALYNSGTDFKAGKTYPDMRSSPVKAYRSHLSDRRKRASESIEQTLNRPPEPIYTYDVVYNGMALRLTPGEAEKIRRLPEVASVHKDEIRKLMTDVSPGFVNADVVWDGSGTGDLPASKGEGVIIGVIDSGIWPEHPSFADDGSYPPPPLKWGGKCTHPADRSQEYTCNNKLIGIQYFLDAYIAMRDDGYDGLFHSGRDDGGHGTHTASTAGGNENVPADIYGIDRGTVSGMAPRAHIAAYKVAGPGGATLADVLAAVNKAVADGVDVINYSIGSDFDMNPWTSPDAQAFLAAREAGVFVTVSAGNNGPEAATLGSPANAPWVATVGANYTNRLFLSDLTVSDDDTPIFTAYGSTPTKGVSNFNLVDAEGIADTEGDTSGQCLHPFATGTFRATDVVMCERGDIPTWAKGNFIQDGGAGAMLLYGNEQDYDHRAYLHPIPTLFVLRGAGLEIREILRRNSSSNIKHQTSSPISASFTQGEPVFSPDSRIPDGAVTGFSSRGPSNYTWIAADAPEIVTTPINVIKPDITAPGVHILAGGTPEYVSSANDTMGRYGQQGELFQIIQGTSMSAPHMAGLAALMKSLRPSWTPAQTQSALISTAVGNSKLQTADSDNGQQQTVTATPFDTGGGRADVTRALLAGFVLDESSENFRNANPDTGGDPSALNLPGLTDAECMGECSWSRIVQSTADFPVTWDVSANGGAAAYLSLSRTTFTLEPGGAQTITVNADVSGLFSDEWIFGEISFTPDTSLLPVSRFPVAVRPVAGTSPVRSVEIRTRRNQGTYLTEGFQSVKTDRLTANVYVGEPESVEISLPEDSAHDEVYDNFEDGVFVRLIEISPDVRLFSVEITASTASDLDLYVGLDKNGDGLPEREEQQCRSAGSLWSESCVFPGSGVPLESGTYWILVQNWEGTELPADEITLAITMIDENSPGRGISAKPNFCENKNSPDNSFDVEISWDIPEFEFGNHKTAWLELGTDTAHPGNIASVPLTLRRVEDDVSMRWMSTTGSGFAYPGDTLLCEMNVRSDLIQGDSLTYHLVSTLPEGMHYVPGSATTEPDEIRDNQLVWNLETGYLYKMSTNRDDPYCATPSGGYVNLEESGISPDPAISGDNVLFNFDNLMATTDPSGISRPVSFFEKEYPDGLYFTDDGLALLSPNSGSVTGRHTGLPDSGLPNALIAPFWRDLEIVYDQENRRGVSIAEQDGFMIIEYDDVEPAPTGSTDERFDFELLMKREPANGNGNYEIIFAYDNLKSQNSQNSHRYLFPVSIGLEDADGTHGTQYAYNDADLRDDLTICFDYVREKTVEIRYEARVNQDAVPPSPGFSPPITASCILAHSVDDGPPAFTQADIIIMEEPVLTVNSGEINISIPDEGRAVSSAEVERGVTIRDLDVNLSIAHPQVEELSAYLISPSGTKVKLFENLSGTRENLSLTHLDDEAEMSITVAHAPFDGTFRPGELLSAFDGEPAEGTWKLKVFDNRQWDAGTLISWGLEIRFGTAEPLANDDVAVTGWDEPLVIDVLANDRDPDGEPLSIVGTQGASHGTLSHDSTSIFYTPNPEFVGEDAFTYVISDGSDGFAEAEVFVRVMMAGASISVTNISDSMNADGKISLREAILIANTDQSADGSPEGGFRDSILLPPGVLTMGEGPLEISEHMNIIGDPKTGTVIEGNGSERVFFIHDGVEVRMENLTIRKGRAGDWKPETGDWRPETGNPEHQNESNRSARIAGGYSADLGEWPWMVALVSRDSDANTGQFCGGTLIHPEWVLTSAGCVSDGVSAGSTDGTDVVMGVSNLADINGEERIQVSKIIIHPDYDALTRNADLALLHLSVPSDQPCVELLPRDDPDGVYSYLASPGYLGTVIGWGDSEPQIIADEPKILRQLAVPIVSHETASSSSAPAKYAYEDYYGLSDAVTENMLVAGDENSGAGFCKGDFGSPLTVSSDQLLAERAETTDGEQTFYSLQPHVFQAGIASSIISSGGDACDSSYAPYGVYTRVDRFAQWIYDTMDAYPVSSDLKGGAVLNQGKLTMNKCTLTENMAVSGGAIFNSGSLTLTNSTLSGNTAILGGGFYNQGSAKAVFTTIAQNSARSGGGVFALRLFLSAGFQIRNTLIAHNTAITEGADVYGILEADGISLISDSSGSSGYRNKDMTDVNPLLVPLRDNGGPGFTHGIQAHSPGVDAVSCKDLDGNMVSTDQRGAARSEKCDIGAFEYDGADYPPEAVDDILFTRETSVEIDVLVNDRDIDADVLFISDISDPEYGSLSFSAEPAETPSVSGQLSVNTDDGEISFLADMITYTPDKDFVGLDTFNYTVSDGTSSSEARVIVVVSPDMLPEMHDDQAETFVNMAVSIDVLANDKDPEGNSLSITKVAEASDGTAVIEGDTVVYTPDTNFIGTDRFMYRVSDGAKIGKAFITVSVEEAPEIYHSADYNPRDYKIGISELLRVIQLYINGVYVCADPQVEDGYGVGTLMGNFIRKADQECMPHDADYAPQDWRIDLKELLEVGSGKWINNISSLIVGW